MLPHLEHQPPRIAVLGTHLALYAEAYTGYGETMTAFMTAEMANLGDSVEIIGMRVSASVDDAAAFLAEMEAAGVEALVLLSLGYTNSLSVTPALCDSRLPLVILNTQEARAVTESFRFDDLMYNHGMQGVQDITAVLVRERRPFFIVTGKLSHDDTRARLTDYLAACRAHARIRGRRIARLTLPQRGMGDGLVEPERLGSCFGLETLDIPCSELADHASEVTADEIDAARRLDEVNFDIAESVTREDHDRSLRLEIALRRMVDRYQLAGLTFSFDHIARAPGIDTIPFLGITKLMAEGLAYGGEGDLLVTAWTAIAHGLGAPVSFTELYTMDFSDNTALCTHMAELNPRMARRDARPELLARTFTLASCKPFCSLRFTLAPGPALLSALTLDGAGDFRVIAMNTEIADFPLLTETWERPNYKVRFGRDIREVMDDYARLGGPHHLDIATGASVRAYQAFAELAGLQWRRVPTGLE